MCEKKPNIHFYFLDYYYIGMCLLNTAISNFSLFWISMTDQQLGNHLPLLLAGSVQGCVHRYNSNNCHTCMAFHHPVGRVISNYNVCQVIFHNDHTYMAFHLCFLSWFTWTLFLENVLLQISQNILIFGDTFPPSKTRQEFLTFIRPPSVMSVHVFIQSLLSGQSFGTKTTRIVPCSHMQLYMSF